MKIKRNIISYVLHILGAIAADAEYNREVGIDGRQLNAPPLLELIPNDDIEFEGSTIAHQFSKTRQYVSNRELILLGEAQLTDVRCQPNACSSDTSGCGLCKAVFCKTDPTLHDKSPETAPNYADIANTEFCKNYQFEESVNEIYQAARDYDASNGKSLAKPLELGVFQMSQSKASEMLGAPLAKALPRKKVISNAAPLTVALTMCDKPKNVLARTKDCSPENAAILFERVSYLICRDANPNKDGCVQVYHSDATESIDIYKTATGDAIPWEYVYGPQELAMSEYPLSLDRSSCSNRKNNPSSSMKKVANGHGIVKKHLNSLEACASSTASNMEVALEHLRGSNMGSAINVLDLPFALESTISKTWNIEATEAQKSKILSAAAAPDRRGQTFSKYVEAKFAKTNTQIKETGKIYLDNLYRQLERHGDAKGDRRLNERLVDWPSNNKNRMIRTRI